jgi:hypothetical protein
MNPDREVPNIEDTDISEEEIVQISKDFISQWSTEIQAATSISGALSSFISGVALS